MLQLLIHCQHFNGRGLCSSGAGVAAVVAKAPSPPAVIVVKQQHHFHLSPSREMKAKVKVVGTTTTIATSVQPSSALEYYNLIRPSESIDDGLPPWPPLYLPPLFSLSSAQQCQ